MNTHQKKSLVKMTIMLSLLAGIWLLAQPKDKVSESIQIFGQLENVNVGQIHIDRSDRRLSLSRTANGWWTDGPDKHLIDYSLVEGSLNNLLQASRSPELDVSNADQFGLQPPNLRITLVENSLSEHVLDIGNPLKVSTDTYIGRNGRIYTTAGNLLEEWTQVTLAIQSAYGLVPPTTNNAPKHHDH